MSDNEQETVIEATDSSSEDTPVEAPKQVKKKREYVMTPARQESVNKMIEIRKKRAEEARKARETKKLKEKQQALRIKKQELKLKEVKLNPEPQDKIKITNEILSDDTDSDDSVEYVVTRRKKSVKANRVAEKQTKSHSPVNYNNEFEVNEPNNFFFL